MQGELRQDEFRTSLDRDVATNRVSAAVTRFVGICALVVLAACAGLAQPASAATASGPAPATRAKRPNILVILADDLGQSDVGAFGGEIRTPNLDGLAREGLRMTDFHVAATCSPTRAMLLTGTDHHRAGIANMSELITPAQRGRPGYEGYLNERVATIAELLHDGGYRTIMSGKWHLGLTPEQDPARRGFERVFALLQAGHNHFGRSREAAAKLGGGAHYSEDGKPTTVPPDFYSSDYFATRLIEFMKEDRERPFFAYLAFSAPHWPLQAPDEDIEKYRGRYDAGWTTLLRERVKRQRDMGLVPATAELDPPATQIDWNTLSADEKRRQSRKMEIYAAMVERLDWNVGRVIDALRASGRLDDTVVIFLSDNGPAPDSVAGFASTVPGYVAPPETDFSLWGGPDSNLSYGPSWAQASSAPRRLYKSVSTNGGTTSPTIVRWPGFARQGGAIDASFATAMDLAPTLLDLAGVRAPSGDFHGRAVEPMRGRSLVPYLQKRAPRVHAEDEPTGWELFGQRALRQGKWFATWVSQPNGPSRWELFDLFRDPGERHDLAAKEPKQLAKLVAAWDAYAKQMGLVLQEQVVSPYTNP